ncbi:hypothetical protein BCR42DRAFT_451538 [Absidia repens]|uniref:SEC7 domain-containing protein n=1 Tax=Absidia repens TaxID=90262 RepID=A0A1X2IHU0_9FUNG|nr:hypothetical protein BCR42DRAFT_451538 [Absidia repens]
MTDTKVAAGSDGDKRHSRRPVWRSLKVVANTGYPNESPNADTTISHSLNKNKGHSGTPSDQTKSRLSNWLSQQLYEHERQAHYSPSWIGEPETSTMSNLSLVSHVSSVSDSGDGRKRPTSVPTSPTSPTIPRLLMTAAPSNATDTIPLPVTSSQPRLLNVMTAKMIPPSSPTTSTLSRTSAFPPPPPLPVTAVATGATTTTTTTTTKPNYQNYGMPSSSALPTVRSENSCSSGNDEIDSGDDDDENDDTYKTAGGSSDYSGDMEDRLDEINNYSDDSIYYINRYYDDNKNSNELIDDTRSKKSTTTVDDDLIDCIKTMDNDLNENIEKNFINEYNDSISEYSKSDSSDVKGLHNNSIFDSMDPEVAQVLLEWRRQSLLKIDWFDMFATKSDLWRSTTLFHSYINLEQQDQHTSSCQSSIATSSLGSLHFKGVPLDKAFRAYSNRIDYSKASVSDIDQALQVFAQLYWECNPSKLLQCAELVYIIIHSLMLLNTDVHAGQEHTTIEGFCASTIKLVLDHQASIPIMLFDADGESTWQEAMTKCLQSLYKSVEKSSLLPLNQPQPQPWPLTAPTKHSSTRHDSGPLQQNEEPSVGSRLDTAFNDMFISTTDKQHNTSIGIVPEKSTSTPQKKKQQRHQRSNSLLSTPSWTLLRRRDTHRTKIGPYKEGPLSCQLNGEAWKICWVILHLGHLHIYHHRLGETTATTATTTTMENYATDITTTLSPSSLSSSSPLPSDANKSKVKKRFMQHLTSPAAVTNSVTNFSGSNNGQMLKNKEPYQEVNIHLGNTFCERHGSHVFLLQLAKGNNTYIFDCGSESQVAIWIRDCNYWAARETKVVLSRELSSSTMWKRPLPPAGASVLDKKGQQEAIDTHLLSLQTELKHHLQQPGWATGPWHDKKMYLELEVRKYQCYHDSIYQQ